MKRVIIAINVILAAGALFLGAGIYRQLARGTGTVADAPVAVQPPDSGPAPVPDRSRVRYNAIVDRDLFGTAKSDQGALNPALLDRLKPTVLKLKLWGTVTGDQEPYAVVEDLKTRQQVLYHVGDSIQNATIKMILRDKVVISAGGKDEILPLEEATAAAGPGPAKMAETPPGMMVSPAAGPGPAAPLPAQPPQAAPELSADEQLARVGLEPQFGEGEVTGLKINRLAPDSVFKRMGLRPGDVLTGFNEQALANPDDAKQLLEQMEEAGEVQVRIRRQGQQQTIEFKK